MQIQVGTVVEVVNMGGSVIRGLVTKTTRTGQNVWVMWEGQRMSFKIDKRALRVIEQAPVA